MARKQQEKAIGRRTFLKLTGASVAAAAGVAATSGSAAATTLDVKDGDRLDAHFRNVDDGDTIEIPRGTYALGDATVNADNWTIVAPEGATIRPVGSVVLNLHGHGWDFGGFRFDVRNAGTIRVDPHGGAYSFHHCAWDGQNTTDIPLMFPHLEEAGTEAEIANCWFGDGCSPGQSVDLPRDVKGDLWFRNCYFYQNGTYSTPSAKSQMQNHRGTVNFDGCYFENCYNSAVRTGNNFGKKCVVKNSVIVFDSQAETPGWDEYDPVVKPFRGVWAYWGDVDVVNTHITNPWGRCIIAKSGSYHEAGTVRAIDCQLNGSVDSDVIVRNSGADAKTTPPANCVTSLEAAYRGISSSGGSVEPTEPKEPEEPAKPTLPNTLSVRGTDRGRVASYTLTVTDTIEGADIDAEDSASGANAKGAVAGGADEYRFAGELDTLTVDGPADVYVNGEKVNLDDYDDNELPNVVRIEGTNGYASYEFGVSGDVSHHEANGATVNSVDVISGASAKGAVAGGADAFAYSGSITAFSFTEGVASVLVNGKEFDPASLDPAPAPEDPESKPPHVFVVDGRDVNGVTSYTFEVSGDLEATNYDGASADSEDAIDGSRVTGAVAGGRDAFRFSGTIRTFDIAGNAAVDLLYDAE